MRYFNKPMEEVTIEELRKFLLKYLKEERKLAERSVNYYNSVIRFMYEVTMDKLINKKQLPMYRRRRKMIDVLTKEELSAFFNACDNYMYKTIFMLIYGSGLRVGEAVNLRIQDIDSKKMRIFVSEGKGKKDRYTVLPQASLDAKNEFIKNEKIPSAEMNISHQKEKISAMYKEDWIRDVGEPYFKEESQTKKLNAINKTAQELIVKYANQKNTKFNSLREMRRAYTTKYQFGYDYANENSNIEFTEELQKIENVQLPQYIDKIRDSKEKSYEQFREDFISKLKANIDEVESQVEELNDALKNSTFGIDKYQFKVKPKQEYKRFYDMITDKMLMEGYNLWSESFNSKYHEEIDELFRKLTSSDISEETYNKNIAIYTDYKTYLSFDLVVTDKDGVTQHLSRTLDKKSGGETQTPFYISVLASFAQLYRINKNRNDNTLRLIVFDEAFNKMDEERMKESLNLLPKFGFQAIIAAPSEKAGEIIPLVPNTLCVIKKGRNTVVTEWEKGKSLYEL